MTLAVTASAPGKAFVSGEYAVLHGAPAVVMAVHRRARVTIERIDGDEHEVIAPGYADVAGRFVVRQRRIDWRAGSGAPWSLFTAVFESASVTPPQACRFSLDTRAFRSATRGAKLGFGSSAALAAALATALAALGGGEEPAMLAAMSGHRDFQGGRGSGADVATSLAGGVIEYRMGEAGWTVLDWPVQLRYRFFYSGVDADTRERIDRAQASAGDIGALARAAEQASGAFRSANPRDALAAMNHYVRALRDYSDTAGLGIFDAGHDVLHDAAQDLGLVYKPCGAGGGDIGMALAHDEATLDVFAALAGANGFEVIDVELDPLGARVSE